LSARGRERADGFVAGGVQAGYLHVHWAAHPEIALRFARAAQPVAV
jgi:cobyrinic acid a,c-diamide synthase